MEHTVYLSAKAFIDAINPHPPKKLKALTVEDKDEDEDNEEEDELDWTADWNYLDSILDNEEVDLVIEFLPGDVLGKVLALVNQVFLSFSQ